MKGQVGRDSSVLARIDLPIEVVPYPRVTVHLPRRRGMPSWTNNPDALAQLNDFYDEVGYLLLGHPARFAGLKGPLSVRIWIWKKRRRGDIDNLCKTILDAFTRVGVWGDDSQIKKLEVTDEGRGVEPRLLVEIEAMT